PHRRGLLRRFGVETAADLAELLLHRYGIGVLPGSAFGDPDDALRLRVATSRLYGDAAWQQEGALAPDDPAALPWIAAALAWLDQARAEITACLCRRSGRTGACQDKHHHSGAPGQPPDRDELQQPPAHHDGRAGSRPQRQRRADADRERVVVAR